MDDDLQEIRDNFYVGNFQKVMNLCDSASNLSDLSQSECDATFARACLGLQLIDKLKVMTNSECPGQRASALSAIIAKTKNETQKGQAKERLVSLAKDTQDLTCNILAACMYAKEGSWQEAATLTQAHPTVEMQALRTFFLLSCNQVEQAEKVLRSLTGNGDDSAAFRLAQVAVHIAAGNAEEAYLICCDLATQFPAVDGEDSPGSLLLLTGKAVANMQRGMFTEAVEDLQRALQLAPNDPDVLVNLCCCATHLRKNEDLQTHVKKLEQVEPTHPYLVKTQAISTAFQRFKASAT
eukprot:CAMPEP_0194480518 /NCGR_PEP_ID=MMETSP0253-20130528/3286_1 /TAXON_ID=2966 /ORGANISM="Noctiluca scintillans" /LENGTH=294 /DNA_ID=CAMNT_0039319911 /DNA_START=86 /DNA_END=970 /DNA_ORIENTATION=+